MNDDTAIDGETLLFNGGSPKTAYTIDSEAKFMVKTINALKDDKYEMIKSRDKYANIDFMLLNKKNLCSVLIEHKRKKISGASYDTFFIGFNKLVALEVFYNAPIYLVFECADDTYWCEYDSSFLKRETKMIRGGKCIEVSREECGIGFFKLISQLKNSLNI
tara:strand:+ start:974 stop:1459 length:486 start_codon:yes stop_codon:yes gene_type:complete